MADNYIVSARKYRPQTWDTVVGQGSITDTLQNAIAQNQIAQAYLFCGPRGVGKTTCARIFANAINGFTTEQAERRFNVFELDAASNNGVEHIRSIIDQVRIPPQDGRYKVYVIDEVHMLSKDAFNAFLKTLEEPGEDTFLLLETSRPEQLLETVRSRVQRLRVLPLTDEALRGEIEQRIPHEFARFDDIVAVAHGSLGLALRAATEHAVQLHDLVRAWFAETQTLRPFATAQQALQGANEKREEIEAARMFLWLLRAELRRQRDRVAASLDGSYPPASLDPWTTWLERTLQAERDLDLLLPPEQVLTACLVQLL